MRGAPSENRSKSEMLDKPGIEKHQARYNPNCADNYASDVTKTRLFFLNAIAAEVLVEYN